MAKIPKMTPGMRWVLKMKEEQAARNAARSFTATDEERQSLARLAGREVTSAELVRGTIHGDAPRYTPILEKPQPRTDYDDEIREAEEAVRKEAESKLSAAQKRLLFVQRKAAEQLEQQAAAENRTAYLNAVSPQLEQLYAIRDRAAFSNEYTPDEYFAVLNAIAQLEAGPGGMETAVAMIRQVKQTEASKHSAKLAAVKAKIAELNSDREDLEALLGAVDGVEQSDDQPEPFRFDDDGSIAAKLASISAQLEAGRIAASVEGGGADG